MPFLQGPIVLRPREKMLQVTVAFSGLWAVLYPAAVRELQPLHVQAWMCTAGAFPPRAVS